MNTTVAVAIPFGESSVKNIFSLKFWSFLVVISIPKNLITRYMPNNERLCVKKSFVNGIWIIRPSSTNTNMNRAFANTVSTLSNVALCFSRVFPKNSPSAVTARTPLPPRFSASTYDNNAAIMTAKLLYTSVYAFCIILKRIIPTNTPAPKPTMNFIMNGTSCSMMLVIHCSFRFCIRSRTINGNITVSGVLNRLSIFNKESILFFFFSTGRRTSGPVPHMIVANNIDNHTGRPRI